MYLQGCPLPTAKFSPMERRWYQGDWWQQAAAVGTPEVNVRTCSPKWVHPATLPGRSPVEPSFYHEMVHVPHHENGARRPAHCNASTRTPPGAVRTGLRAVTGCFRVSRDVFLTD